MSENYKIGYLLRDLRKAKKITQEQVAYGIYGKSSYSRIEAGTQDPDKLLLDVLFERMGMSVNQFGTNYTITEYLAIEWRNSILEKLIAREWTVALSELAEYDEWLKHEGRSVGCAAFHEQFHSYIHLVVRMERAESVDLESEILTAIRYTVHDFQPSKFDNFLYGEQELALLILLAENWFRCGAREKSVRFYRVLLEYMEERIEDEMERYRFYPETVLSLAAKLYEMGRYEELIICEKGVEMLQKAHRMNGLEGLLHLRLAGWEKCGVPEAEKKQYTLYQQVEELLVEIREKAHIQESGMSYPLLKVGSRGYVLGERILRVRTSLGMTQEELCEGICTPETVSRIERGERAPKVAVYEQLMKKLGMEECRYYPFIESNDYRMYLGLMEYETQLERNEYEKAEKELTFLEENLDKTSLINQQILLKNRAVLNWLLGRITAEKSVELLWEAFYMTVPQDAKIEIWPLDYIEVEILNNIATELETQNRRKESITLLKKIKKSFEFASKEIIKYRKNNWEQEAIRYYSQKGMRLSYNTISYLITVENLIKITGNQGDFKEALRMAEEMIGFSYETSNIYTLWVLLYENAWNKEQILEEEQKSIAAIGKECVPIYYQSYLIAAITNQKSKMDFTNERCSAKYNLLWESIFCR